MSARIGRWLLAVLLVTGSAGIRGEDYISVRVTPSQSFAPAHLRLYVRIAPSAENRALQIAAESDNFYRSSTIELNGERAPRYFQWDFPDLPSGDYELRTTLYDAAGHERASACEQAHVIPAAGE